MKTIITALILFVSLSVQAQMMTGSMPTKKGEIVGGLLITPVDTTIKVMTFKIIKGNYGGAFSMGKPELSEPDKTGLIYVNNLNSIKAKRKGYVYRLHIEVREYPGGKLVLIDKYNLTFIK